MTELSKEARALIEAARDQYGPAAGDKARVLAKIKAAAAAPAAPAASSTAAAATSGVAAKWVVLGVAALIAGGVALQLSTGAKSSEAPANFVANDATTKLSETPGPAKFVAKQFVPQEPAKLGAEPSIAGAPAKFVGDEPSAKKSALAPKKSTAQEEPAKFVTDEPAPAAETAEAKPAPENDPPNELLLLREARIALRDGRAEEALALAAKHEQTYPSSVLTEERLATQALAACTIGQYAQADRAIAALIDRAPASEHLARIHRACKNRTASEPKKISQPPAEPATQQTP